MIKLEIHIEAYLTVNELFDNEGTAEVLDEMAKYDLRNMLKEYDIKKLDVKHTVVKEDD